MRVQTFFVFLASFSLVFSAPQTRRTRIKSATKTRTSSTTLTSTSTTSTLTTTRRTKTRSTSTSTTSTSTSTSTTSTLIPTPTRSLGKRGLAFNDPALTDYFSLSGQGSKVNWAYSKMKQGWTNLRHELIHLPGRFVDWASDPYYAGPWTPNSYNPVLTFTPMLWSNADDLTSIWNANVHNAINTYGADSVLAFNEPDGCCWSCGNSCMNVSLAVSAYQQWIQPWAGAVRLGAPAVTNSITAGMGMDYMTQFMGNCTGCTVDFIPLHWYGSVLDPNSFKTYVQSFWVKFGKPVWITEFAPTSGTDAQIIAFLDSVLPWLDQQTYVQRYSYFMDRAAGSPYLLETNDTLTDIGVVFNSS